MKFASFLLPTSYFIPFNYRGKVARNSSTAEAISCTWVSNAKWPVLKKRTLALGLSFLNASAPAVNKKGSLLPQAANNGGCFSLKYL